jgi:hypothetical protein
MVGMAALSTQIGLPRDVRAMTYLVSFLVTTVATVLITRATLALSGFPQLGGSGLHIAHVVWGGLVLAVGVVVLLSFVGPVIRPVAVVISGIGFGLFLDEVGKFVTSTNNYFFRPAVAIMYIVTVLFILAAELVHGRVRPRPTELLANAVNEAVSATSGGISEGRRARALEWVDAAADQPGAAETAALLRALPVSTHEPGDPLIWLSERIRRFGRPLVAKRWLRRTVIVLLCLNAAASLITVLLLIGVELFGTETVKNEADIGISALASAATASLTIICVVLGLRSLRRDRARAYAWFVRSLLVDLLLTQPIIVASEQFSQLTAVAIDLIMLAVVATAKAAATADSTGATDAQAASPPGAATVH